MTELVTEVACLLSLFIMQMAMVALVEKGLAKGLVIARSSNLEHFIKIFNWQSN